MYCTASKLIRMLYGVAFAVAVLSPVDAQAEGCVTGALRPPADSVLWRRMPESELEGRPLLVGSDLHGELSKLKKFTRAGGFTDENGDWLTGNRGILVLNGDLIDHGEDSFGLIMYMRKLQNQAAKAGGEVIAIYGNREVELLSDLFSKPTNELMNSIKEAGEDPYEVLQWGSSFVTSLDRMKLGAILGESGFLHSGNVGRKNIRKVSAAIRDGDYAAEAVTSEAKSPIFAKNWEEDEELLAKTIRNAKELGMSTLVVGHQPGGFGGEGIRYWKFKKEKFSILKVDTRMGERAGSMILCPDAAAFSKSGPSVCRELLMSGVRKPLKPHRTPSLE